MAKLLEWDKIAAIYGKSFSNTMGAKGMEARIVIGALIIKHIGRKDGRGTIEMISENPLMHFFSRPYLVGTLSYKGNIRHILTTYNFSTSSALELSEAKLNTYQNGASWGTPVGWVAHAIAQVDSNTAKKLAEEYVQELREGDFRKGENFGAPWECFNAAKGQNPVYLTSIALPFLIFNTQQYEFK